MPNALRYKKVVVVGHFKHIVDANPVRRIGTPDGVAGAVLFVMTNTFMTGMMLKVDGGDQ